MIAFTFCSNILLGIRMRAQREENTRKTQHCSGIGPRGGLKRYICSIAKNAVVGLPADGSRRPNPCSPRRRSTARASSRPPPGAGAWPVPAGTSAERGHGAGQRSASAVVVARRFAAHASRSVVRSRTRFPKRWNAGPAPLTEDARLDRHRLHERALRASATMPSSAHAVGFARSSPNPCAWRSGRARLATRRWRGGSAPLRPARSPAKAAADAIRHARGCADEGSGAAQAADTACHYPAGGRGRWLRNG